MLADSYDWGEPIEKDIFVWGKGETELRTETKIGGLPYRASGKSWPTGPDGDPLPFLGQVNFSNSTDIISVSNDILLVFARIYEDLVEAACFEWQSIDPSLELVRRCEVPETVWKPHPFHGHIVRVKSFPAAVLRSSLDYPVIDGKPVCCDRLLLDYHATEIGKHPAVIQPCDSEINDPICVLASLQPATFGHSYPWVNESTPCDLDAEMERAEREVIEGYPDSQLMFGDGGSLYIYRDETGEICTHVSDY
jgi:hypothetical protein